MSELTWSTERRKLRDLSAWSENPREISEAQAARLAESLREFGQIQTIAVEPDGTLIDGHQRRAVWAASQEFGPDYEVDVRVPSRKLTHAEREKLVVYLHAGATGDWDWDKLSSWDAGVLSDWGMDADLLHDWNDNAANLALMIEAAEGVPDFAPVDESEQPRLDQKAPITCPHCGMEFIPE